MLASLKRKDELIQDLKKALLVKDRRIDELEVALADQAKAAGSVRPEPVEAAETTKPDVPQVPSKSGRKPASTKAARPPKATPGEPAMAAEPASPPSPPKPQTGPDPQARFGSVIIAQASRGLYSDGWTGLEATLVLNPELAGKTVVLSFFLPPSPRSESKTVTVSPNFSDRQILKIKRGQMVPCRISLPERTTSPPFVALAAEEPEPVGNDHRALGVVLVSAVVKPSGNAP